MKRLRQALESAKPQRPVCVKGPMAQAFGQYLATESQAMDMVEMQKFAVELSKRGMTGTTNPSLGSLKQYYLDSKEGGNDSVGEITNDDTLYTIDIDSLNDTAIIDVTQELAASPDDSNFSLLVNHDQDDINAEMRQVLATLECMVLAHGGSVYTSFDAYINAHK